MPPGTGRGDDGRHARAELPRILVVGHDSPAGGPAEQQQTSFPACLPGQYGGIAAGALEADVVAVNVERHFRIGAVLQPCQHFIDVGRLVAFDDDLGVR